LRYDKVSKVYDSRENLQVKQKASRVDERRFAN